MDYQQTFFKEQIKLIHDARDEKEEYFEKMQKVEHEKVKQFLESPPTVDNCLRAEKAATLIKHSNEFVGEREKLLKDHEEKKAEMKKRHHQEELKMEMDFDADLAQLMDKYSPLHQLNEGNNGLIM